MVDIKGKWKTFKIYPIQANLYGYIQIKNNWLIPS